MATATKSTRRAPAKGGSKPGSGKARGSKAPPKGRKARAKAKAAERDRKLRARSGSRWRVHYDTDGPRIRLGMVWFLGAMLALVSGTLVTAVYFGLAGAAASAHALRTWRARREAVDPLVALVATALVVLAATVSPAAMGAGLMVATVGITVVSFQAQSPREVASAALARAGLYLQTVLPPAVAGGCFVLLRDQEIWAALSVFALVSAFEVGDYVVGSGSANSMEGPVAGAAAVAVTTLLVAALGFRPFEVSEAVVFGLAVAPLAWAGQFLGTAMLPHARAFAPALRRVDSMLLAVPFWYFGISFLLT